MGRRLALGSPSDPVERKTFVTFVDTYSQPDAPDPVLSNEVVVEVARRHVAGVERVLAVDESGGEARAYHLDGGVVVKTQRPPRRRPRTSLEKERNVLRALDGVPGVRCRFLELSDTGGWTPWSISA